MCYYGIKEDSSKFFHVLGRRLLTRKYRIRILLYRKDGCGKIQNNNKGDCHEQKRISMDKRTQEVFAG